MAGVYYAAGLPNEIIYRARGDGVDDGAPLRAILAAAAEGSRIVLPDIEYQFYTTVDSVALDITSDNITLVGRGRPVKGSATVSGYGATRFRHRAGVDASAIVVRMRGAGDPQAGTLTSQIVGGGLSGIVIDANSQAGKGLVIAAAQHLHIRDFAVANATATQMELSYLPHSSGGVNTYNHIKNVVIERGSIFSFGTGPGLALLGNEVYGAEAPFFTRISDISINHGDYQGMLLNGCDDVWIHGYTPISSSSATDAWSLEIKTAGNNFTLGVHVHAPTLLQNPKGAVVRATGLTTPPQKIFFHGLGTVDRTTAKLIQEPGAGVTLVGDDGTHNLTSDLAFATPDIADDFIAGSTTTTDVGELKWNLTGGGGSLDYVPAEAHHPGIIRLTVTAGNYATIRPGAGGASAPLLPADAFDAAFILRSTTGGSSDTNVTYRFGFGNNATSNPPTDGIYVEKLAADTAFYAVCRASGTETRTNLGSAFIASAWLYCRIRRYSDTVIGFSFGQETNGVPDAQVSTNVPTAVMQPFIGVGSAASVSETIDADAFKLRVTGLDRMTA